MDDFCRDFFEQNQLYEKVVLAILPIGIFLNLLAILILCLTSDFKSNNLFRYILAKTISDTLNLAANMFLALYDEPKDGFSDLMYSSYVMCTTVQALVWFVINSSIISSSLCEIAAIFNRYRFITGYFRILDKIPFGFKIFLIYLIPFVLSFYDFFLLDCRQTLNVTFSLFNSSDHVGTYEIGWTSFANTEWHVYLDSLLIFSNIALLFPLCAINLLTYIFLRKAIKRQKSLRVIGLENEATDRRTNSNSTSPLRSISKRRQTVAERAQIKFICMVFVTSGLTLAGKIPMVIVNFLGDFGIFLCGFTFANMILLCYFSNIFVYFFFNSKFRLFFSRPWFNIFFNSIK
jgi:hypothetical protein